jgi:predicted small metal-binding protein
MQETINGNQIMKTPVNTMVSFKCKDIGMNCPFEATVANVRDLDDKIAMHARDAHKMPSMDKEMWMKIHKAEK